MAWRQSQRVTRVALVGKTGSGKSTLGNALLQRDAFNVSAGFSSCTSECLCAKSRVDGREITVVDTPGTFDTNDRRRGLKELKKAIDFCPDGFHAFLLVVKSGRFTAEENEAIATLRREFGDGFLDFSIFVFTNGDQFDNDLDMLTRELNDAPSSLTHLLNLCSRRVALVENGRRCNKRLQTQQLRQLLSMIDSLHAANGEPYTNSMFLTAQKERLESERARVARERSAMEQQRQQLTEQRQRAVERQQSEALKRAAVEAAMLLGMSMMMSSSSPSFVMRQRLRSSPFEHPLSGSFGFSLDDSDSSDDEDEEEETPACRQQ